MTRLRVGLALVSAWIVGVACVLGVQLLRADGEWPSRPAAAAIEAEDVIFHTCGLQPASLADQLEMARNLGVIEGVLSAYPDATAPGLNNDYPPFLFRRSVAYFGDHGSLSLRLCAPGVAAAARTWSARNR